MANSLSEKDNCPKCGTKTLERDPEGDMHCWGCGTTFPKDPKMETSCNDQLLERHRLYENNKAAILADVQSIGAKATAKKWKINGASLHHALKRWEREAKQVASSGALKGNLKSANPGKKFKRKSRTRINNFKRHRYYEDNKEAIIADLLSLGRMATSKRWGIPKTTLLYLEQRWLTERQRALLADGSPPPLPSDLAILTEFPAFSNDWTPEVQLKWLEIYDKLLDRHSSENR